MRCDFVYLEHCTRVHSSEHNDSSSLKRSDPQAEPHLSALATLCHPVLDVAVPRETQGGLTYTKRFRRVLTYHGDRLQSRVNNTSPTLPQCRELLLLG